MLALTVGLLVRLAAEGLLVTKSPRLLLLLLSRSYCARPARSSRQRLSPVDTLSAVLSSRATRGGCEFGAT